MPDGNDAKSETSLVRFTLGTMVAGPVFLAAFIAIEQPDQAPGQRRLLDPASRKPPHLKALFPEVSYFTLYAPMALILAVKPTGLFGRE